jgi:hypothetical protein
MCIVLFLSAPALFARDSIPDPAPMPQPDSAGIGMPAESEQQAYWKPAQFENIPVEETVGRQVHAEAFKALRHKYDTPEFNYSEQALNRFSWWDRLRRSVNDFFASVLPDWSISSTTLVLRILAILGVCALIFVIYRLVASGKKIFVRDMWEKQEAAVDLIEKNLETTDIRTYLDDALAQKNYTLAIRFLHLINLQTLARKGFIAWDYRKTNHDFLMEIQSLPLREGFEKTRTVYEYIWYGNFAIDESRFLNYQALFVQFKSQIG